MSSDTGTSPPGKTPSTEKTPPETRHVGAPFADLNVPAAVASALTRKGYEQATPVQAAVMEASHANRDLLVSARTGSGKTVAFGLAMVRELLGDKPRFDAGTSSRPLAVVVAPTRELALQVQRELAWLLQDAGGRTTTCVGGTDMSMDIRGLRAGPHVVVGTPGRLCDHLDRGTLILENLKIVVLDEADEMLDMGFRDELEKILGAAPKERRTLLFSATIPAEIVRLAARYQKDALRVAADRPGEMHADIEYRVHLIDPREREHAVVNVLRFADASSSIVFVATRDGVNHLHASLVERGFDAVALSGELTQTERNRAVKSLRDGRARVLVCTDVAARGLDLPDVGLVIQVDPPHDGQVLQHRSGRTGRAGKHGVAVILAPRDKKAKVIRLLKDANVKVTWTDAPSGDMVRKLDQQKLIDAVKNSAQAASDDDRAVARVLMTEGDVESMVAALVAAQRAKLPVAEDLPRSEGLSSTVSRSPASDGPTVRGNRPVRALSADRPVRPTSTSERPARPSTFEKPARPSTFEKPARPSTFEKPAASTEKPTASTEKPAYDKPAYEKPVREKFVKPASATTERPAKFPRGEFKWFKVMVGREGGADPRWLLPMLCRRGDVEKADIGAIRIEADATLVQITAAAADKFALLSKKPEKNEPKILPVDGPVPASSTFEKRTTPRGDGPPRKPFGTGGTSKKPGFGSKPYKKREE